MFDLFIDTFKLVRCCVRTDVGSFGSDLTAILKFYPKTGSKTMEKSTQSTGQYSCPTDLKAEVLIKTQLRPFLSVILYNF